MGITILGGINQGLIWALLAIGVFVTFRILDFADLTVEGSFALGGLIAALFINNLSLNPFLATFVAMLAGGVAGLVTGLLNVKLKIPPILSGILTMTALVSINLLVTGGTPSIPVLYAPTVYNWIFPEGMKIAEDLSDFHARETPEPAAPVRAAAPAEKPRKGGALYALLGLVGLAGALTAGVLYFHDPILRQFPPLRGVYENVCRTLPCPGFAWSDVRAFEIRGELAQADSPRNVRIEITNASDRPHILPLLEVRLLNSADETLAQRLFEPADYGFAEANVLRAGETVRVEAELEVDAEVPVRGVRVTAVTPI